MTMTRLTYETCTLNIRYDLPGDIWRNISDIYQQMEGWLGYGNGKTGEKGTPYWFGYNVHSASISATVKISGLQFAAYNIEEDHWSVWIASFESAASEILSFKVCKI